MEIGAQIYRHVTQSLFNVAVSEIQNRCVNHRSQLSRFGNHYTPITQYSGWRFEVSVSISTYPPTKRLMPSSHQGPYLHQQALRQVSLERSKSDHLRQMRDLLRPRESQKMTPIPDSRRIESGADHPHSNETEQPPNSRTPRKEVIQHSPPRMPKRSKRAITESRQTLREKQSNQRKKMRSRASTRKINGG